MITAVTGINWGDEGKGRVIDQLSGQADIVARYQGGDNAGHTVVCDRGRFVLNLLPSGILHPDTVCVLGTGMVIDPDHLKKEIDSIRKQGIEAGPDNLKISDRATLSMPWHVQQDELEEDRLEKRGRAFGSTRRGIAYAYSDKYRKKTLRAGDLLHPERPDVQKRLSMILEAKNMELCYEYGEDQINLDRLLEWCERQSQLFAPYICDTGEYLSTAQDNGKTILLEAQLGALRDIDYGIFPFTSSSSTIAAYGPVGAGMPGTLPDHVVGVMKAYSTCVGAGPFTAEKAMDPEWRETLRKAGGEYGAATGRPRRVGPFDAPASRYGLRCQQADLIALTKLDVLSTFETIPVITGYRIYGQPVSRFSPLDDLEEAVPETVELPGWNCDITGCRSWDELPSAARDYVIALEQLIDHPIQFISVGPGRDQYLTRGGWL